MLLFSECNDLGILGGKASSLVRLLQAGFAVPDGFVVLADEQLDQPLIISMCERIGGAAFAVRSSGSLEDGAEHSFAGQFDTYLNVTADEIAVKVQQCRDSSQNRRLQAYIDEHRIDMSQLKVTVIVQRMVQARVAGVLFTKNPVTTDDSLVIEAVRGLGEALVSGAATPDTYMVDRSGTELESYVEGERILTSVELAELAGIGERIEAEYGQPMDIEWAYDDQKLWILQARPITTLAAVAEPATPDMGEPDSLFYWGPSRALPEYMADFMLAEKRLFTELHQDGIAVPETLVLFHAGQMVWLSPELGFNAFVSDMYYRYFEAERYQQDYDAWRTAAANLTASPDFGMMVEQLAQVWQHTLRAEFALYGYEAIIGPLVQQYGDAQQEIMRVMTQSETPSFLTRIAAECAKKSVEDIAQTYPWLQDGYGGVVDSVIGYVRELQAQKVDVREEIVAERQRIVEDYQLSEELQRHFELVRHLSDFIDERKAWMMQTRRLIANTSTALPTSSGWYVHAAAQSELNERVVAELWAKYVLHEVHEKQLAGIVAYAGAEHVVSGVAQVVLSPIDDFMDGRILVAPSTSPSYIRLMRRARGFITDHGGMMSHAAIVARELHMPCIVGSKAATKLIKTGDMIHMNMKTGEVEVEHG